MNRYPANHLSYNFPSVMREKSAPIPRTTLLYGNLFAFFLNQQNAFLATIEWRFFPWNAISLYSIAALNYSTFSRIEVHFKLRFWKINSICYAKLNLQTSVMRSYYTLKISLELMYRSVELLKKKNVYYVLHLNVWHASAFLYYSWLGPSIETTRKVPSLISSLQLN